MDPECEQGQVGGQAVDHSPALACIQLQAEDLQYIPGDQDPAENCAGSMAMKNSALTT